MRVRGRGSAWRRPGAAKRNPAGRQAAANSAGVRYPSELCGRRWLYSRRWSSSMTFASCSVSNTSRSSNSSRNRLLNLSL